jgi:hypothetical protein
VFNNTTSQTISGGALQWNNDGTSATLLLTNQLPDGNYTATLNGGFSGGTSFFVLAGDANRDRNVSISDFAIVASRFNQPGTFGQGDFNYDGSTDISDFAILASKFNTVLPAPTGLPREASAQSTQTTFSARRVWDEQALKLT